MSQPIRMCIICRQRALQESLQRLQIINGELVPFSKSGRSFYICKACMTNNEKKVVKILNNKCKTNHKAMMDFGKTFKETATNG
ncbi:putative nucleic-acid-binding protein implicated in transcription termination [Sulfurospirillum barnesii SES-3]|uniref:Putative nucleic-acid-binding protein implicated in transcription termination n=1 Tax=Sulfurospirillum barnesii (strain ATCC 700032 / DSM 10660 / SES-3) TaxID=760154 RepID=I3XUG8_SULBS|nr:putative nucleic-acid-binding protein implicated in transcription termination [Sulfurospirillum barnesii SES-3]